MMRSCTDGPWKHNWNKFSKVDIMDAEGPDAEWDIPNGKVIKKNLLGKHIENYDSMLVLVHFKGHPMGGYGGALKQLSIGCASSAGKANIHTGGKTSDPAVIWDNICEQDIFLEAMADAAVSQGMPRKQAYKFASQTVLGSAKMVLETGRHPGDLKDMVCSPAGTTIEGVRILEKNGFRSAVFEALTAAAEKGKKL